MYSEGYCSSEDLLGVELQETSSGVKRYASFVHGALYISYLIDSHVYIFIYIHSYVQPMRFGCSGRVQNLLVLHEMLSRREIDALCYVGSLEVRRMVVFV